MQKALKTPFICACFLAFFCTILNQPRAIDAVCDPRDKEVLLQIKNHFNNTYPFSGWDPKTDCCSWPSGVLCGSTGRVTYLRISEYPRISGVIPPQIGDLPFLEILELDQLPKLTGTIPSTFAKLTNLTELSISMTGVGGPIPEFLSQLKSLEKLYLDANQFNGTIPSSLSLLPNLFDIVLSGNRLTGTIPESFGSLGNSYTALRLDRNELSGLIPKSLGQANITFLYLSSNKFEGDASFLLAQDKPLQEFSLKQNRLEFNISNADPPMGLTWFDISYNKIYGPLPRRFGQLRQLRFFNVSNNQLCGKIPKGRHLKQFSPSGFAHNKCLCDAPGLPPCMKL